VGIGANVDDELEDEHAKADAQNLQDDIESAVPVVETKKKEKVS
jgi:hypothetical protein